jgi:hypothetical protein
MATFKPDIADRRLKGPGLTPQNSTFSGARSNGFAIRCRFRALSITDEIVI